MKKTFSFELTKLEFAKKLEHLIESTFNKKLDKFQSKNSRSDLVDSKKK